MLRNLLSQKVCIRQEKGCFFIMPIIISTLHVDPLKVIALANQIAQHNSTDSGTDRVHGQVTALP